MDIRKTVGTTMIVVCAFLLFCLITRSAILGAISNAVANFFLGIFGLVSYAVVSAGVVAGIMILLKNKIRLPKMQIVNFFAMFFAVTLFVHLITSQASASASDYLAYLSECYDYATMGTFGGAFAGLFVWPLCNTLSVFGAYVFIIALVILTVFICIEYFFKISNIKLEKQEKEIIKKEVVQKEMVQEYPQSKLFVSTVDDYEQQPQQKVSKSFEELYGNKMQTFDVNADKTTEVKEKSAREQLYGDYWKNANSGDQSQQQKSSIPNTSYTKDFEKYYSSPTNNYEVKSAPVSSFEKTFNPPPAFFHGEDNISSDSFSIRKADEFLFEEKTEKQIKREEARKSLYALKGWDYNEVLPPIVNGDEVSGQLKKTEEYAPKQPVSFVEQKPNEQENKIVEEKQVVQNVEPVEEKPKSSFSYFASNDDFDDLFEEDIKRDYSFDEKSREEEINKAVFSQQPESVYISVEEEKKEEVYNEPVYQEEKEEIEQLQPSFDEEIFEEKVEEISVADMVVEEKDEQPVVDPEPVKLVEKPFINKTEKAFQVGIANVVSDEKQEEKPIHKYKKYIPPIYSLLDDTVFDPKLLTEDFEGTGLKIQETLAEFKVEATLRNIVTGPTVTRYEFEIARGVSVTKVNALVEDITYAIAASAPVRIQTPIPGKSLFGIEVPNKKIATVSLRSVLESSEFVGAPQKGLTYALGIDIGGKNIVSDIADMPHMLIAGATGQGKSVCVNSIIISMLYKYGPEELRFIMVDPKQVEFTPYGKLPHLMINQIICEPEKAISAFDWLIKEMERRFKLFAEYGVREINGFNNAIDTETTQKLPRIVLIVDEVADLMQYNKNEIESRIQRLTQKARAAGIHLILATQRPSVDVITGVIKANIPSRLALRVSSVVDSRTILDQAGAEKLVAKGDMLFRSANMPEPIRLQGAFVSDSEVGKIVDYIAANNECYFDNEVADAILKSKKETSGGANDSDDLDELFYNALRYVIEVGQASNSMIQRRFNVGYNRAGRLVQEMEDMGFVSKFEGAKPRQVLISEQEYEERFGDK